MAREMLIVPEGRLADVIMVIRCGLIHIDESAIHDDVTPKLLEWCDRTEYLKRLEANDGE